MRFSVFLLFVLLIFSGCAKPPEQVYSHPKTGIENLDAHISECGELAEKFGIINMSPIHNFQMEDMRDFFQRRKIFRFCMLKKGYEI